MPYDPTTGVQSGKKPPIAVLPKEPVDPAEPGSGSPANPAIETPPIVAQKPAPAPVPVGNQDPNRKRYFKLRPGETRQPVAAPAVQPPPQAQPLPALAPKPGQRPGGGGMQPVEPFDPVADLQKQMGDPNSRFNKMSRDEVLGMVPWLKDDPNFANMSDGDLRFLAGQHIGNQIKSGDMGAAANWAGQLQALGGGSPSVETIAKGFRGNTGVDPGWNIGSPTQFTGHYGGGWQGVGQMPEYLTGGPAPFRGQYGGSWQGGRDPMRNDPEWNRVPHGGFGSPVPGGNGMSQEQLNEQFRLWQGGGQMPGATTGPQMSTMPIKAPPGGWPRGNAVDGGVRPGSIPGYGQPPQMAGPSQGNRPVPQMPPPPQGPTGNQMLDDAVNNLNNPDWVRQQQDALRAAQDAWRSGGQQGPPPPQGGGQYQNHQYPPQLNEAIGNLNNPDWVRAQEEALRAAQNAGQNGGQLPGGIQMPRGPLPGQPGGYQGGSSAYYTPNTGSFGPDGQMQNIAPQTRQPGIDPFNPIGNPQRRPRMSNFQP